MAETPLQSPALPDIDDSSFPVAVKDRISDDRQVVTELATDTNLAPGTVNPLTRVDEALDNLGQRLEALDGDPQADYLETPAEELARDLSIDGEAIREGAEELQDAVVTLVEAYEDGSLYPVGEESRTYPEAVISELQDLVDEVVEDVLPQIDDEVEVLEAAAKDDVDLA